MAESSSSSPLITTQNVTPGQCTYSLDSLSPNFEKYVAMGVSLCFFIHFIILYSCREIDRNKNYYGRIDAPSGRESNGNKSSNQPRSASPPPINSKPAKTSLEEDAAAEDELQGRNPNKVSVVRDNSPTQTNAIKVMVKRRRPTAGMTVRSFSKCTSVTQAGSEVSAKSFFGPRILFDSTGRGLEVIDLMAKDPLCTQGDAIRLRDGIVELLKAQLDQSRDKKHVVYGIPDRGSAIVRGAECLVGMGRQTLVLSLICDAIPMKLMCFEPEIGDTEPKPVVKHKSKSMTKSERSRQGEGPVARTPARSPAETQRPTLTEEAGKYTPRKGVGRNSRSKLAMVHSKPGKSPKRSGRHNKQSSKPNSHVKDVHIGSPLSIHTASSQDRFGSVKHPLPPVPSGQSALHSGSLQKREETTQVLGSGQIPIIADDRKRSKADTKHSGNEKREERKTQEIKVSSKEKADKKKEKKVEEKRIGSKAERKKRSVGKEEERQKTEEKRLGSKAEKVEKKDEVTPAAVPIKSTKKSDSKIVERGTTGSGEKEGARHDKNTGEEKKEKVRKSGESKMERKVEDKREEHKEEKREEVKAARKDGDGKLDKKPPSSIESTRRPSTTVVPSKTTVNDDGKAV